MNAAAELASARIAAMDFMVDWLLGICYVRFLNPTNLNSEIGALAFMHHQSQFLSYA